VKKIKTVVVGLGRIAWSCHIPEIMKHEGFELVALLDPLEERRKEAEKEFKAKSYSSLSDALREQKPDLAVIASPTMFHAAQSIEAMENSCDVFCDKPMTISYEEALSMEKAMKKNNRRLMVYQPHRATAETISLRNILAEGLIGELYMIKFGSSNYVRRNDWQAFLRNGGGMLNNYGVHFIDMLLYIAQSPVKNISCKLRRIASLGDADDVVKAVIETQKGLILDIDINMASALPITPWQIFGKNGTLIMDTEKKEWKARFFRPEELPDSEVYEEVAARNRKYPGDGGVIWHEKSFPLSDFQPVKYYDKCYEYFALGKTPFIPIEESVELIRVIEECRKTAEANQ